MVLAEVRVRLNLKIKNSMKTNVKPLSIVQKVLFSIYPFGILLFIVLFFLVLDFDFDLYMKIWWMLFCVMIIQIVALIFRLRKVSLDRSTKIVYAFLLVSVFIFQIIYIWYLDDKYIQNPKR